MKSNKKETEKEIFTVENMSETKLTQITNYTAITLPVPNKTNSEIYTIYF